MKKRKLMLVFAAIASLCAMSAPAGAEPAAPNALAGGIPPVFKFINRGNPGGPSCIYYNEVAAGRGDAVDESTCRPDARFYFNRRTQADSYVRFELGDFIGQCLIGDTSTSPGVVIVGSCDDPRADWGGGGVGNPTPWNLYPRSNPSMYLRDNGIAVVLQQTEQPWNNPEFVWRLE